MYDELQPVIPVTRCGTAAELARNSAPSSPELQSAILHQYFTPHHSESALCFTNSQQTTNLVTATCPKISSSSELQSVRASVCPSPSTTNLPIRSVELMKVGLVSWSSLHTSCLPTSSIFHVLLFFDSFSPSHPSFLCPGLNSVASRFASIIQV